MTITAELLKTAAASFTEINKNDDEPKAKVIDLAKVTDAVIKATAALQEATDDPDAAVEALTKRLEDLTALLEKAVEAEDGTVTVTPDTEEVTKLAEEFEVEEADDGSADGGEGDIGGGVSTTTVKGDGEEEDDSDWPLDMAPEKPPLLKSARLTKGERPIPARPGARARVKKRYGEARDQAFGRCLSPGDEDK